MSREPYYRDDWLTVFLGDCRAVMADMEPESVNCVVTSPPYWGLRDYGIPASVWDPLDYTIKDVRGRACEHEWGPTIIDNATNHTDKRRWQHTRNGRDEEQPPEKRVAWRRTEVPQGAFCQFCDAWSGVLGLEPTPDLYVEHVVALFREVRRVLRKDGTVWLNLGDSYAAGHGGSSTEGNGATMRKAARHDGQPRDREGIDVGGWSSRDVSVRRVTPGLKPKDRVMVPARVALALQADGWWLRDEIVWSKPNPMPSSVADRTTPAHEMVYLLSRSPRYAYDADAIKEPLAESSIQRINQASFDSQTGGPKDYANGTNPNQSARKALENFAKPRRKPAGWNVDHVESNKLGRYTHDKQRASAEASSPSTQRQMAGLNDRWDAAEEDGTAPAGRNKRSVWVVPTEPYPEAHFATFPQALIEPMILAGCPEGGTVLDPFAGSGTVGLVSERLGRRSVLIDASTDYLDQLMRRIAAGRSAGTGPPLDMPVPLPNGSLWEVPA